MIMSTPFTRRVFLGGAVTLVAAPPLAACVPEAQPQVIDGWTVPPGTRLEAARYATLAAAMDAIVPLSARAHAAWYLDQLFGAFDVDPPRIFAGGPYSGRHGGTADFARFIPLDRIETLRWRTYLEGSRGLPEREWNGPVKALIDRYREGLDDLDQRAQAKGSRFSAASKDVRRSVLLAAPEDFVTLIYEHAVEGTYGDPAYGGNVDSVGWAAIAYEGDRHPLGYNAYEMLHPEAMPKV